jgi:hypothetical protein
MKPYLSPVLIVLVALLSSYFISTDRPKAQNGYWTYDLNRVHADTSIWSNYNQVQINFHKMDNSKKAMVRRQYLGISFNRWPVPAGDYRIGGAAMSDTMAAVHATDPMNTYHSKTNNTGSMLHVTVNKEGKHTFWANNVAVEIYANSKHSFTGLQDSTFISFNLTER